MLKGAPTGARKNIPAAKKMVYLAAGGNPVGERKGRGIHLWVTLVILSLAVYLTSGLPNPKERMGKETDPQETQLEPTWGQNIEPRVTQLADQGKPLDAIFLEFSPAFDTVSHKILLDKMSSPQLDKQIMQWGSILILVLFNIFLNYLDAGLEGCPGLQKESANVGCNQNMYSTPLYSNFLTNC
ncbi:hypothetical protein DUI87_03110 [Hirundo rustica rustica]|uniref:Reverse transcriptase domain-containing protein n=1 Tax=Hirundo rustica rustica TaxID=333673 RepID=A0A3M0L1W9_HIRRU|nr:hypothetical protein DUI87_03110 [Hirundo rustica rustica]